jgi:hypothetical protein
MVLVSRLLSSLFVVIALLLTLASLPSEWLLDLCAPTDQFGNRISLIEAQRRGKQLSREVKAAIARLEIKDRITEALMGDKMTLIDAAVCFRSLYEDPKSWHHPYRPRPEPDDAESWCIEVMNWTEMRVRLTHSLDQAEALRQRLEAELQEQMDRYSIVTLPE